MIVALDGPAGVGKSTLAKKIAQDFGLFFLNSGAWYRAVTRAVIDQKINISEESAIVDLALQGEFQIIEQELFFNGQNTKGLLHTQEIDSLVAQLSAIIPLRRVINDKIRELSKSLNLVVEGRDMTTEAFPEAEIKFFIDAKPEVRAQRRFEERPEGSSYGEILSALVERDAIDRNKPVGALKIAEDSHYIDTSDLTFDQVYEKVKNTIRTINSPGA